MTRIFGVLYLIYFAFQSSSSGGGFGQSNGFGSAGRGGFGSNEEGGGVDNRMRGFGRGRARSSEY